MHLMKLSEATVGQRVRLVTVTTTGQHPQRYDIGDDEWTVGDVAVPMFRRLRAVNYSALRFAERYPDDHRTLEVGIDSGVFVGDDQ